MILWGVHDRVKPTTQQQQQQQETPNANQTTTINQQQTQERWGGNEHCELIRTNHETLLVLLIN